MATESWNDKATKFKFLNDYLMAALRAGAPPTQPDGKAATNILGNAENAWKVITALVQDPEYDSSSV